MDMCIIQLPFILVFQSSYCCFYFPRCPSLQQNKFHCYSSKLIVHSRLNFSTLESHAKSDLLSFYFIFFIFIPSLSLFSLCSFVHYCGASQYLCWYFLSFVVYASAPHVNFFRESFIARRHNSAPPCSHARTCLDTDPCNSFLMFVTKSP